MQSSFQILFSTFLAFLWLFAENDSLQFTHRVIFWHQEPQRPQWPQQPQWPQWPQWPQQPHFIKKLTEHDDSINLATKLPILVSHCGMNHQKSTILWTFCHSCCRRLWRPWMVLSTKSKGHKSNVRILWMYRFCFYNLKVHFWWPNKCLLSRILSLNTL